MPRYNIKIRKTNKIYHKLPYTVVLVPNLTTDLSQFATAQFVEEYDARSFTTRLSQNKNTFFLINNRDIIQFGEPQENMYTIMQALIVNNKGEKVTLKELIDE